MEPCKRLAKMGETACKEVRECLGLMSGLET